LPCLRKQAGSGLAAVEHRDIVPGVGRSLCDVPADERGTADDEDAHR